MSTTLVQCVLHKPIIGGFDQRITFIPKKFAAKGKVLKLKNNGIWDDGWIVHEVYGQEIDFEEATQLKTAYKRQRAVSDRIRK